MQHFMHDVQVDNLNIPVECLNLQTTTMQQLFNKDFSTGTLNDMSSELGVLGMEYWAVITSTKPSVHDLPTNIWSISGNYCLSGAASEHYLDEDGTLYLANTYQVHDVQTGCYQQKYFISCYVIYIHQERKHSVNLWINRKPFQKIMLHPRSMVW